MGYSSGVEIRWGLSASHLPFWNPHNLTGPPRLDRISVFLALVLPEVSARGSNPINISKQNPLEFRVSIMVQRWRLKPLLR